MWLNVYDTLLYCSEDFPSAATASGLPSMYLQYGWKLQGLLQEASLISTISFFINLTEIALDRARHIHLIKSQTIALQFHFIIARHVEHPTAVHRDFILSQWDSQHDGWDFSISFFTLNVWNICQGRSDRSVHLSHPSHYLKPQQANLWLQASHSLMRVEPGAQQHQALSCVGS